MTAEEGTPRAPRSAAPARPALAGACLTPRDALRAAVLFATALGIYAATAQARIYGHDGAFLVNSSALGIAGHSNSALYSTVAALARRLAPDSAVGAANPLAPLLWISHVGGALGVACAYLIARALGAPVRGALFGAALFALAPVQWFYATAIETHALHVGVVGLAALACLLGPWRTPWLARAVAAAGVLLLYPTHMTGLLLLPGWLWLARAGRARRASELPLARDLLATGACCAAAALLSIALANRLFGAGFTLYAGGDDPTRFLAQFTRRFTLAAFWSGWVLPLFLLLPVAVAALATPSGLPRAAPVARRALLALVLVPTAVLLWLSIPERGAYHLGGAPFLAALCAFAPLFAGARGWLVAAALVSLQGIAGRGELARFDSQFPAAERAAAVRAALGERGVVITLDSGSPKTAAWLPDVVDYDLSGPLFEHEARGAPPAELADFLVAEIRRVFPAIPVALDLTYRRVYERPPDPALIARLEPYLLACELRLQTEFRTRLVEDSWWPLLVLMP